MGRREGGGYGAESALVDIAQPAQIALAAAGLKDNQRVDILVNDAGYLGKTTEFVSHTQSDWQQIVRVNAPGPIDTDMIRGLGSEVVDQMINDSPLRRLGQAREVAELVAWLCTDASRFNTGAIFDMSGGRARY